MRWLSLGPSVQRILEQWDCICSFVKPKHPKTAPTSVAYRRVLAMLNDEEGKKTKVQLEFMGNVSPVFKHFLTVFQNSFPQHGSPPGRRKLNHHRLPETYSR